MISPLSDRPSQSPSRCRLGTPNLAEIYGEVGRLHDNADGRIGSALARLIRGSACAATGGTRVCNVIFQETSNYRNCNPDEEEQDWNRQSGNQKPLPPICLRNSCVNTMRVPSSAMGTIHLFDEHFAQGRQSNFESFHRNAVIQEGTENRIGVNAISEHVLKLSVRNLGVADAGHVCRLPRRSYANALYAARAL